MTSTLRDWADALDAHERECFWPGPRPMRDPQYPLIGRDGDIRDFTTLIREVNLIVLSGESGVGKSSLLQAGIHPRLRSDGFQVLICSDWSGGESEPRPAHADTRPAGHPDLEVEVLARTEQFLATKLAGVLPPGIPAAPGLLRALDDQYGDGAVIILDQFEELIRHHPVLYERVRMWVENAVDRYSVRIVISLREEFKHRLRDLVVGPFKRADFYLLPLRSRTSIERVITSGRRSDGSTAVISEAAVEFLLDLWEQAGGGQPWSGVGLLHLQALLYVCWREASDDQVTETAPITVTLTHVLRALQLPTGESSASPSLHPDAAELFRASLARAVTYRLATCRDVFLNEVGGGDPVLADGVVALISRMADHLASGGYKVDQEERHLAQLVLADELGTLGYTGDLSRDGTDARLFSAFARRIGDDGSWLTASRDELLAGDPGLLATLRGSEGVDTSSGPMMGLPRSAVLLEELRRYFFALEWLVASALVRRTSGSVALTHDGFGRGLSSWAEANPEDARSAVSRLTATLGRTLTWQPGESTDQPDPFDGTSTELGCRFVNLRWRSSRLHNIRFRQVVFINGDFRWTSFDQCVFEGVTFVNCLMDGVEFSNCTIVGSVSEPRRAPNTERPLPSFFVRGPQLAAMLDRYLETPPKTWTDGKRELISWTSGLPAEPASAALVEALKQDRIDGFQYQEWDPQESGLLICGGRLSSLMFASCRGPAKSDGTHDPMGTVSLRHVAGTSLEFGEQGAGSIQLADVAVRGLTISPQVWLDDVERSSGDREHREAEGELTLDVVDSHLQNVWFSTPLRGRAQFRNSVVWQLFNGSGQSSFSVELDEDSPNLGVVNGSPAMPPLSPVAFTTADRALAEVDKVAKKVDYQSLRNLLVSLPDPPTQA